MNYLLTCFLLAFIGLTFAETCDDVNEEYKECGTACPRTCDDPRVNRICIEMCKRGCFCKEPFIRDETTGKCVLQSKCTNACVGPNENYTDCGTACPETCANMNQEKRPCIDLCVSGCFCNPGFVRDSNNTCVLKRECPQVYSDEQCAQNNEVYKSCGTACPTTCKNYMITGRMCMAVCKSGCFCQAPYVREESTGKCVLTEDCPQVYSDEQCADENEVYKSCGTACPTTCKNYKSPHRPMCMAVCKAGCFCQAPYVRDESTGKCVLTDNCPQIYADEGCSGDNEIYKECGSGCPPTCKDHQITHRICPAVCKAGCFCQAPYVRDETTGKCMLESKCTAV